MIRKVGNKLRSSRIGFHILNSIFDSRLVETSFYKKLYFKKINKVSKKLAGTLPKSIEIGITNVCNADCIMCPHRHLKKMGFMDMKLYKKIVDDAVSCGMEKVALSFFGEAMLDKNLEKRIRYAKYKGLKVSFFTNASKMDKEKAKMIIKNKVDNISVSLDSPNKETYEKIRRNLKFEDVRDNILNLIKLKKKAKSKFPLISLAMVEMEENSGEAKAFYNEWKDRVDSINMINMRNWSGKSKKRKAPTKYPCALLWRMIVVDWNGEVVLCCNDWNHEEVVGDLNKESIRDVWNGKKLKRIRMMHLADRINCVPVCAKCDKKTDWWLG